jgi:hypothetical protein
LIEWNEVFRYKKEGHVRANCPMWKKVMEEAKKNSKPKVGINVAIVEWD